MQRGADVDPALGWLHPAERAALDRLTVPKRRRDWLLGRWTAKRLLAARLGAPPARLAVLAADDGAPEPWLDGAPLPLTLAISHSGDLGLAAARARLPLGADVELIALRDPALVTDFFTPAEQAAIARAAPGDRDALVTAVWSAKESALKALRVGLREDARAADVTLAAPPADAWAPLTVTVRGRALPGWHRRAAGAVLTVVGPDLDQPPRDAPAAAPP